MALVVSNSGEEKVRRSSFRGERRPWLLKDYLKDDMSSCSSNGFRSLPRRQCCVAIRNIIENEIIIRNHSKPSKRIPRNHRSRNRSFSSVLQRASMAVINAVKLLPFKSPAMASEIAGDGKMNPPKTFSKKLFKKSFWTAKRKSSSSSVVKKEHNDCDEIERWLSSGVIESEKYQPSDFSNDTTVTNSSSTTTSTSNSNGDVKSDSWSDITFTSGSDYLTCSSENDAVERREKSLVKEQEVELAEEISRRGGVTPAQGGWLAEVSKKEELSPISILDFPDNDEGSLSPFTLRITRSKGTQERLMNKLRRFESLVTLGLEPLNIGNLVSCTKVDDQSPKLSTESCSMPTNIRVSMSTKSENEEEAERSHEENEEAEEKAKHLLKIMKARVPTKLISYKFEPINNLLLDFFQENGIDKEDETLLKEAEDWVNGNYDKMISVSKVKDKRAAYVRDMKGGNWGPRDGKFDKEEVLVELGTEVLGYLIDELLEEFCCCSVHG